MKILFFLDIDGTLILENQKPNTDKLQKFIKKLKNNQKVLFGLNSNRSIEDLTPIYKKFNLNGPLIVENGIYFKKGLKDKEIFLLNSPPFLLPKIIREKIRSFCKASTEPIHFEITNTVKALKKLRKNRGKVILMNKFRKYTASLHTFNNGQRDYQLAKEIKEYLENDNALKKLKLEINISEVFSNVLIQTMLINKGKALSKLRQFYPGYRFIMIGDDENDLTVINNVDVVAAVNNATKKFKKQADIIAKQSYTKGVLEIIKYFLKYEK